MGKRYKLIFELSGGTVLTVDSPARIDSFRCETSDGENAGGASSDLETAARQALAVYRQSRLSKNNDRLPQHTTFSQNGVELQVVGCYMAGLSITKTLDYLRRRHGVIAAKSPLGRVFREFFKLKIKRSPKPLSIDF